MELNLYRNVAATLLNPWALNANGKIISIENATKGEEYRCPVCKEPMSYCKKGIGPHAKIDHFRHKVKTNCEGGGESLIHKMAKEKIYDILRCFIDKQLDLPIVWTCPDCHRDIEANLLKRAKDVRMEHDLDEARPDIDLLDENGKPIVAIEIVFTHDVEEQTLCFYDANNIVLIRIIINSAEDCNDMLNKLQHPDSCNLCFHENCERYATLQPYRKIIGFKNDDGIYVRLGVAIYNPFENVPKKCQSFTEIDKQNALTIAKELWADYDTEFVVESGFELLKRIQKNTTTIHRSITHRNHPTIEQIEAKQERRKWAIKRNYAKMASSNKGRKKRR